MTLSQSSKWQKQIQTGKMGCNEVLTRVYLKTSWKWCVYVLCVCMHFDVVHFLFRYYIFSVAACLSLCTCCIHIAHVVNKHIFVHASEWTHGTSGQHWLHASACCYSQSLPFTSGIDSQMIFFLLSFVEVCIFVTSYVYCHQMQFCMSHILTFPMHLYVVCLLVYKINLQFFRQYSWDFGRSN